MMKQLFFLIGTVFFSIALWGQQLKASVEINAEKTGKANLPVFKTLKRATEDFLNNTDFTGQQLEEHERIVCNFYFTVMGYENNIMTATLQVQSSRPVFGSTMNTPVLNINDKQANFKYIEFQPLNFDENSFTSNLVSLLSYYAYTILGADADSFAENGGTRNFQKANQIVNYSQQGQFGGVWKALDQTNIKPQLNAEFLSSKFSNYRKALYTYHLQGLDYMYENQKDAKQKIAETVLQLKQVYDQKPNSLLLRSFFDAKTGELVEIFSGGPSIPIKEIVNTLQRIAPTYSSEWKKISY